MPLDVKDITHLLKETDKARDTTYKLLDFVDLIKKAKDEIEGDIDPQISAIAQRVEEIAKSISHIKRLVENELDNVPVDMDEVRRAVRKLLLYQGNEQQVLIWADQQKKAHKENSYWWRYWQSVYEEMKKQKQGS